MELRSNLFVWSGYKHWLFYQIEYGHFQTLEKVLKTSFGIGYEAVLGVKVPWSLSFNKFKHNLIDNNHFSSF